MEFEREDWTAFRTLGGLCRKAGVPQEKLAEVVVKELVDNALDAAGDCELRLTDGVLVVEDRGPGILGDDAAIGRLFSMSRPMASSKYLRLPARGALGNGLRVVIGAVASTGGKLFVATKGRTLEILPDNLTGESRAVRIGDHNGPGTRVELELGSPIEVVSDDLLMADVAIVAARSQEKRYTGKTSAHWYNVDAFHDRLLSVRSDDVTVREFIAQFEGCSGKAGKITNGFGGRLARSLSRDESKDLLRSATVESRVVNPDRLGSIGETAFPGAYHKQSFRAILPPGTDGTQIRIPVVIEAWADPCPEGSSSVLMVNGTPCVEGPDALYQKKEKQTIVYGCGLRIDLKTVKMGILLHVNITTPYMPLTSDGKAPDLGMFKDLLAPLIDRAVKRSKRIQSQCEFKTDIKSVVFDRMAEQIAIVSDNHRYRFNWRQVFYRIRPIVKETLGEDLDWGYFNQTLVTAYEEEFGEDQFAYRDPRGTFYSPHDGETFPLGTLQVERFSREAWQYNKVLFLEKEGFFEALKADGWPERHDLALMTSKGQSTRAARDLIDLIGNTDEPVQVFCLHDSDASGTMIFQSLQEATRARPRRNVEVINLGLDPPEAVKLAGQGIVEMENVSYEKRRPTAAYIDDEWNQWLQTHRVELDAFTTPEFIDWLDRMMNGYAGKVIPPADVMAEKFNERILQSLRESITNRILAEAGIDRQVDEAFASLASRAREVADALPVSVGAKLSTDRQRHWGEVVESLAQGVVYNT